MKKIDEFNNKSKNPDSPESQKFLSELSQKIKNHREKMKKIYQSWKLEDKNEAR